MFRCSGAFSHTLLHRTRRRHGAFRHCALGSRVSEETAGAELSKPGGGRMALPSAGGAARPGGARSPGGGCTGGIPSPGGSTISPSKPRPGGGHARHDADFGESESLKLNSESVLSPALVESSWYSMHSLAMAFDGSITFVVSTKGAAGDML